MASSKKCSKACPAWASPLSARPSCRRQGNAIRSASSARPMAGDGGDQAMALPPPIHVVAFARAIEQFEGGQRQESRQALPRQRQILIDGMRAGFQTLLPNELQAPIIVTFHMPTDPKFVFQRFYDAEGPRLCDLASSPWPIPFMGHRRHRRARDERRAGGRAPRLKARRRVRRAGSEDERDEPLPASPSTAALRLARSALGGGVHRRQRA